MEYITVLVMAIGLSMDSFAVSVSNSMCYKDINARQSVITSFIFGVFQGTMPIVGYFFGTLLGGVFMALDHWLALVLLAFIGGKMLVDAIKELKNPESLGCDTKIFSTKTMILQAVATSIDALAVGISFFAINANIFVSGGIIGLCTFVFCIVGGVLGRKFGQVLGGWAQALGGVILIGLGIKIFAEHMFF